MIVDAHRHYWNPSHLRYGWLDHAPASLRRSFLPEDAAHLGDACILVQAAPDERETRYLFALAGSTSDVLGVVGWVDMEAADVASRLDALIADGQGLLRGIRPMVQDIPDAGWLASASLDAAFDAVRDRGLVFDALVDGRHLHSLHQRLLRHPGLRTVIDHAAKPDIAGDGFVGWSRAITQLARMPDVHCKLSGLLTLTGPVADERALAPYVAHLFDSFGSSRLLWGSDWPVLTTHASYDAWKACARELVQRHAPDAIDAIFGGNALATYSIASRTSP